MFMGCGGDTDDDGDKFSNVKLDFDYKTRLDACSGDSCFALGTIYYDRSDRSKYKKEISETFDKGCTTSDYGSCLFLAALYNDGDFFSKDATKFKSYLDKAWDLGSDEQKASIVLLYPSYNR